MKKIHDIKNITFQEDVMNLIVDGKTFSFMLNDISPLLKNASLKEKEKFIISPSGYGISWPAIEEDISIDGLLKIKHKPHIKKKQLQTT